MAASPHIKARQKTAAFERPADKISRFWPLAARENRRKQRKQEAGYLEEWYLWGHADAAAFIAAHLCLIANVWSSRPDRPASMVATVRVGDRLVSLHAKDMGTGLCSIDPTCEQEKHDGGKEDACEQATILKEHLSHFYSLPFGWFLFHYWMRTREKARSGCSNIL